MPIVTLGACMPLNNMHDYIHERKKRVGLVGEDEEEGIMNGNEANKI